VREYEQDRELSQWGGTLHDASQMRLLQGMNRVPVKYLCQLLLLLAILMSADEHRQETTDILVIMPTFAVNYSGNNDNNTRLLA